MPSPLLIEKLYQSAKNSPAFKYLALEKQAEMLTSLENTSDKQILEAIKVFEEDIGQSQHSDEVKLQNENQLMELSAKVEQDVIELKAEMKKVDDDLVEKTNQEEVINMESQIADLNKPVVVKRKKFLGIF